MTSRRSDGANDNTTIVVSATDAASFRKMFDQRHPTLSHVPEVDGLDQYFGLWCVEPTVFMSIWRTVVKMDLAAHVAKSEHRTINTTPKRTADIALIDMHGSLTKRGSSLSAATSLIELRRAVRVAADDATIDGILLRIDSPGGTLSGTSDLASEVKAANKKKPVFAFVEDMAASAAYWIASQAESIFMNDETAVVGSIGTFIGLLDSSKMAENEGIRPVVIKSGKFKGAGFPGTPITAEIEEEVQKLVDKTQVVFNKAVADGRNMTMKQVEQLGDGGIHLGKDAIEIGLADGIKTFDQTLVALAGAIKARKRNGPRQLKQEVRMDRTTELATLEDLNLYCSGADSDWKIEQLKKSATLDQAMSSHGEVQEASIKELTEVMATGAKALAEGEKALEEGEKTLAAQGKKIEELEAQVKELEKKQKPGVKPLGTGGGKTNTGSSAKDQINLLVADRMKNLGESRSVAFQEVVAANTELRDLLVEEAN